MVLEDTVGERILARLKELSPLTQQDLANKAKMPLSTLNTILRGTGGTAKIPAIAVAMGLCALWLAERRGPRLLTDSPHVAEQPIGEILTDTELRVLDDYRAATEAGRTMIQAAAAAAPKRKPKVKKTAKSKRAA